VTQHNAPASGSGRQGVVSTTRYTGNCLCGGVRYVLSAELGAIEVCYCQMCRKASGGPLATNAPIAAAAFHLTAGRELLTEYASSPGERRVFCAKCGSPLYSRKLAERRWIRVRVGTINEPLNVRPAANYHVGSRCNWWEIRDALPSHETE
jgi:hypothetical protein